MSCSCFCGKKRERKLGWVRRGGLSHFVNQIDSLRRGYVVRGLSEDVRRHQSIRHACGPQLGYSFAEREKRDPGEMRVAVQYSLSLSPRLAFSLPSSASKSMSDLNFFVK